MACGVSLKRSVDSNNSASVRLVQSLRCRDQAHARGCGGGAKRSGRCKSRACGSIDPTKLPSRAHASKLYFSLAYIYICVTIRPVRS